VFSRIVLVVAGIASVVAAGGCGGTGEPAGTRQVVAAFYPLAFLAEQVAGTGTAVDDLTPDGAEPHDLELTARDVHAVRDADLVLYLGHGFQPALEEALAERDGRSLDLLAGERLAPGPGDDGEPTADPHVWLDPVRFVRLARATAGALGGAADAEPLVRRLRALDGRYRNGLRSCARREIVTGHSAFGYLARRYGLREVPLAGLSPEAEASPRDLERLAAQVRALGATTVFSEPLVSPRLAETLAREAGVMTAELDPLESLAASDRSAGRDYVSVMDRNLAALRAALGCR
jgi:zinc transport system substrate-binding protein